MVGYVLQSFEDGTFWTVEGRDVKSGKVSVYLQVSAVAFQ
jgi:hypothetical protein